jgi:hypothetical protein
MSVFQLRSDENDGESSIHITVFKNFVTQISLLFPKFRIVLERGEHHVYRLKGSNCKSDTINSYIKVSSI